MIISTGNKADLSNFLFRCVIAELFNEGNRLFDLSELLSYRNGDYDPTVTLSNIEDANIRVRADVLNNFFTFEKHRMPL